MPTDEIIMYRGQPINVSLIRDHLQRCRNSDGTPYFSSEEIEKRVRYQILQKKRFIGRMLGKDEHGGFQLAFYQKERQLFPEAFKVKVSDHQAELIVRKLLRHFTNSFRAKRISIRFWGHRDSGSNGWGIRLSHEPSIGLICHEVAHEFHRKHDKILMRWMKKLVRYCKKMNYWGMATNGKSK